MRPWESVPAATGPQAGGAIAKGKGSKGRKGRAAADQPNFPQALHVPLEVPDGTDPESEQALLF